jgi:hypothetical protein
MSTGRILVPTATGRKVLLFSLEVMEKDRHAAPTANRRGMVGKPGSLGGRKDPSNCRKMVVVVVILDVFKDSDDDDNNNNERAKENKGKKTGLMMLVVIIIRYFRK